MNDYITITETAKLIRKSLKRAFPGTKFSVRSRQYSMGCHVDIHWENGPTSKQVEAVVNGYSGESFDSMIDMSYSTDSWLLPDGSAVFAGTKGTTGSAGVFPAEETERPHPEARRVSFAGSRPSLQRDVTDGAMVALKTAFAQLSEDERSRLMQETNADLALSPYEHPGSYHLDATLSDFGDNAGRVFRQMAYQLPL